MKKHLALFFTFLLIGFLSDIRTLAMQNPGRLSGSVKAQNGEALPGVTVTISSNGISRTAVTGPDGSFRFSDLKPGDYTVRAAAAGFSDVEQKVTVGAEGEPKLDLKLPVSIPDEATVPTGTPVITGVGEVVEQMGGTPIIGGAFKSNVPVGKIELEVPEDVGPGLTPSYLPPDWKAETTKGLTKMSGPPRLEIPLRFTLGKDWSQQLEGFFKKPVELKFGFGNLNYGSFKFDFKPTGPVKPVLPAQAADVPEVIRPGSIFSITPKIDYQKGSWKLSIGNDVFDAYVARNPTRITSADVRRAVEMALEQENIDILYNKFGGTQSADPMPHRFFHVPKGTTLPPGGKIKLTHQNEYGETTVQGEAVTRFLTSLTSAYFAPPRLFRCTPKIFHNRSLCVCGFFPNFFTRSQLLLDGKRLDLPLAGSTDTLTFLPKDPAPGRHVLSWDVPAFDDFFNPEPRRTKPAATERVEFEVLLDKASIDQDQLLSGQKTDMYIRIIWTEEKLSIELENTTPEVIELEGSIKQVGVTSGGKVNVLKRWVKAQKTGKPIANFNITYRLALPPCPCNPGETEKAALGGTVTTPPDNPPGNQPGGPRKDCELILSQYNALSVEYGKLQTDLKRVLESCDRLDDGTIAGRERRDNCRILTKAVDVGTLNRIAQLRKQLLDLLAAYRECTAGAGN